MKIAPLLVGVSVLACSAEPQLRFVPPPPALGDPTPEAIPSGSTAPVDQRPFRLAVAPPGAEFLSVSSEGGVLQAAICEAPCSSNSPTRLVRFPTLSPDAGFEERCASLPFGVESIRTISGGRSFAIQRIQNGPLRLVRVDRGSCTVEPTLWTPAAASGVEVILKGDERSDRLVVNVIGESTGQRYSVDPAASDAFLGQRAIDGCGAEMVGGRVVWRCAEGQTEESYAYHFAEGALTPFPLPRRMWLVGATAEHYAAVFTRYGENVWSSVDVHTGTYALVARNLPVAFTRIWGDERNALARAQSRFWTWSNDQWDEVEALKAAPPARDVEGNGIELPTALVGASSAEIWVFPKP
ncbi:MAG: hypothetical protein U1E65_22455 [Myxococcota bacterium]